MEFRCKLLEEEQKKSPYLREIDKLWIHKMAAGTRGPSGLWGRESMLGEIDKKMVFER